MPRTYHPPYRPPADSPDADRNLKRSATAGLACGGLLLSIPWYLIALLLFFGQPDTAMRIILTAAPVIALALVVICGALAIRWENQAYRHPDRIITPYRPG